MIKVLSVAIFISLSISSIFAQRQTIFVNPQTTDPLIDTFLAQHYVSRTLGVTQRNQLMVFFPGTGGTPLFYRTFANLASDMGFNAIGLNYVNGSAVNDLCAPTGNLDCYGNVRLEVLDGTDRSDLVSVNRPNSIENRLVKLLIYMRQTDPSGNWAQYLDADNQIRWEKIIVAGHSQGGGFSGIIGKNKVVARVIMFAAMDFSGSHNSLANWILASGVTPASRIFAFGHQQDEQVNYLLLSTRTWPAYGLDIFGPPVNVENVQSPYNNAHSLNSNFQAIPSGSNYHGAIVVDTRFPVNGNGVSIYEPVWRFLLSSDLNLLLNSVQFRRSGLAVSRPQVGITTKNYSISIQGGGFDAASRVVVNGIELATEFVSSVELKANVSAGKFGGVGNSNIRVRNQTGQLSNPLYF